MAVHDRTRLIGRLPLFPRQSALRAGESSAARTVKGEGAHPSSSQCAQLLGLADDGLCAATFHSHQYVAALFSGTVSKPVSFAPQHSSQMLANSAVFARIFLDRPYLAT
jgi:hypothetical protein